MTNVNVAFLSTLEDLSRQYMKPGNDTTRIPTFVQRRGFCYDIMVYKDTDGQSLDPEQSRKFLESYERLRSTLGYVSYTDVSRELKVTPLQVMQHVKFLHVQSKGWLVRFSCDRNNENVLFKLLHRT
jgi:hypothetical protein